MVLALILLTTLSKSSWDVLFKGGVHGELIIRIMIHAIIDELPQMYSSSVTSTTMPDNTELPFGLVSSSHQPCHSTHAHQPKVDNCRFSGIHLVVWQPEADLIVHYSFADRLGEFTNRIIKNALSNQLPPNMLSDQIRHSPTSTTCRDQGRHCQFPTSPRLIYMHI
jgi:hypothetical protein